MKKKNIRKLGLHKTTVHNLKTAQAARLKGGIASTDRCISIDLLCWVSYYESECPTNCETCATCNQDSCLFCFSVDFCY